MNVLTTWRGTFSWKSSEKRNSLPPRGSLSLLIFLFLRSLSPIFVSVDSVPRSLVEMSTDVASSMATQMVMPLGMYSWLRSARNHDSLLSSPPLTLFASTAAVEAQVGKKVWVIMRGEKEFTGTLTGYDEFISTNQALLFRCSSCSSVSNFCLF